MSEAARRVLLLCDAYWNPHGGTEGQIHALVAHLPASWSAELWIAHHSPFLEEHPFPCRTRSLRLGSLSRPWTWMRVRRLGREVRRRGFDLVQTFMGDASLVGPVMARVAGVPVLVSRRDLGFWHTPRTVALLRRTGRLADGFLANAEAVKRHVVEVEHVPPADVAVVHNGHAFDGFARPRVAGLRAAHGIPDDAVVVVLLANLKPLKRQPDLVEAAARLVRRHPRLHVLLLGGGPQDDVRATATRCGVEGRVTVHHAQGGAIDFLHEAAVGVLCSETEGLSNAVLEYMACGLPVVATDVGGNPDLVVPGETGFLYPPGDVAALASHLDALLGDDALRARMGAAATARFRDRFGLARMVRETVAVYDRVLRGEPVGREARPEAVEGPGTARPGGPQVAAVAAVAADGGRAGLASPSPAGRPFAGSFETVTDLARVEALAPAWAALVGDRQFFLTPTWATTWLRWAAPAVTPHVLVARDGAGAVVGVLPLARRGRTLELAGAAEGADHLDVVAAPGRASEVAEGFLAHLEALPPDGWARLVLRHVAEDGALRHAVRARRWRLPYREAMATVCPFVAVAGTYDDYLKRFSAKHRGNLRRQVRAWRDDPTVTVARVTDPAAAADAIDVVMALHAKRFAARGAATAFAGESIRRLHRALAPALAAEGRLSIVTLRAGGVPVAAHYGFRFGGRLLHFQGGFDPAFRDRSPGTALTTMVLEDDVFGGGLTEYDFLDGDEAYKLSLSTGVRRLYDLVVSRPTLPSRALSLTLGALSLLRGTKGS